MNTFSPELNQRHSIRLKNYDYSSAGAYFVTICTQNRVCLFGKIVGAGPRACPEIGQPQRVAPTMILNNAGRMITNVWHQIPVHYPGNDVDELVVMPNHIHGIIIVGANEIVGAGPCACPINGEGQPQGVAPMCFGFHA